MRIIVHGGGEVSRRVSLMLLGSPEVSVVATWGFRVNAVDERLRAIVDPGDIEASLGAVVDAGGAEVADGGAGAEPSRVARDREVPFYDTREWGLRRIAERLGSLERGRAEQSAAILIGYTEPGRPLLSGTALPFPEPVGARWGRCRRRGSPRVCVAKAPPPWAAVTAVVTQRDGSARAVGVADLHVRLQAFALAAAVLAGGDSPSDYVDALLDLGMEVAATTVPAEERGRRARR